MRWNLRVHVCGEKMSYSWLVYKTGPVFYVSELVGKHECANTQGLPFDAYTGTTVPNQHPSVGREAHPTTT
jgi:hypothetical protein